MSNVYHAVVLSAGQAALKREAARIASALPAFTFELFRVAPKVFLLFVGRASHWRGAAALDETQDVASELSRIFGKALAAHIDDRLDDGTWSAYFEAGSEVSTFGEEVELCVPVDAKGDRLADSTPVPSIEIPPDSDLELVWDGIDAGLEAIGLRKWFPDGRLHAPARKATLVWDRIGAVEGS